MTTMSDPRTWADARQSARAEDRQRPETWGHGDAKRGAQTAATHPSPLKAGRIRRG
jgi:hypothetical protein